MATTAVATTAATHGEVHGATTTAQAVSSKLVVPSKANDTNATAQAVSLQAQGKLAHAVQIQRIAKLSPSLTSTCATRLVAHSRGPTYSHGPACSRAQCVAKPSPSLAPMCATRRVAHSHGLACSHGPACSRGLPSSPNQSKISSIVPALNFWTDDRTGSIFTTFSSDLTFPNSNLTPIVYHTSTAQGDTFIPSSSNPNGEQHLSRQVIELTSALTE
ncbi:hypothetical protein PS1_030121 [Malus domestica]